MNTPVLRYSAPAVLLHWLTALALLTVFSIAFYMEELPLGPSKLKFYSWHKWAGVTVFLLVLARIGWRLWRTPPAPVAMAAWQQRVAEIAHRLLYLCMLAMPLTGWLMSSAKGFQTVYFGVLPLPDLLEKNPPLGKALAEVHESIAWLLLTLIALHVLAALKHHFIDRDTVLARMVPGLRAPKEKSDA